VGANLSGKFVADHGVGGVVQDVGLASFVVLNGCLAVDSKVRPREEEEVVVLVAIVKDVDPVQRLAV